MKKTHLQLKSILIIIFRRWKKLHWKLLILNIINRDHCRQLKPKGAINWLIEREMSSTRMMHQLLGTSLDVWEEGGRTKIPEMERPDYHSQLSSQACLWVTGRSNYEWLMPISDQTANCFWACIWVTPLHWDESKTFHYHYHFHCMTSYFFRYSCQNIASHLHWLWHWKGRGFEGFPPQGGNHSLEPGRQG